MVPPLCDPSDEQLPSVIQAPGLGTRSTETMLNVPPTRDHLPYLTTFLWHKERSHKGGTTVPQNTTYLGTSYVGCFSEAAKPEAIAITGFVFLNDRAR